MARGGERGLCGAVSGAGEDWDGGYVDVRSCVPGLSGERLLLCVYGLGLARAPRVTGGRTVLHPPGSILTHPRLRGTAGVCMCMVVDVRVCARPRAVSDPHT